jgi:hypothetical protein
VENAIENQKLKGFITNITNQRTIASATYSKYFNFYNLIRHKNIEFGSNKKPKVNIGGEALKNKCLPRYFCGSAEKIRGTSERKYFTTE